MSRRALFRDGALSLRDFLHRSKVLKCYRDFMRELQGIDVRVASELRGQIRQKFKDSKEDKNRAEIVAKMTDAQRELQFLRQYVGTARWKMTEAPAGTLFGSMSAGAPSPGTTGVGQASAHACGHSHSPGEACDTATVAQPPAPAQSDTWAGTGEAGDIKGRVGHAWPWQQTEADAGHSSGSGSGASQDGQERQLGQWEARGHSGPLRIPKR